MQVESPGYFIPSSSINFEQTIKHSRFICHLGHGAFPEQIHAELNRIRHQHPKAHHVCWAFIAGPPATAERGISDDGEPRGTAGRPMLQVLEHSGFGEIWVAVVRYFGGTKLGRGGLIRAYTSSVQNTLELVEAADKQPLLQFHLLLDYNLLPVFEKICRQNSVEILQKLYTDKVEVIVSVPEMLVDEFQQDIARMSNDLAKLKPDYRQ